MHIIQARIVQLVRETGLIRAFKEARTECRVHVHSRANDLVGDFFVHHQVLIAASSVVEMFRRRGGAFDTQFVGRCL